jgi:hypothetical protein
MTQPMWQNLYAFRKISIQPGQLQFKNIHPTPAGEEQMVVSLLNKGPSTLVISSGLVHVALFGGADRNGKAIASVHRWAAFS